MKVHCSNTQLPDKPKVSPTVGDIFGKHGHAFRNEYRPHPRQHKVMCDIEIAGGINTQGQWVEPKYSLTFLFPVRALSNVFRDKFLSELIAAHGKGLLDIAG